MKQYVLLNPGPACTTKAVKKAMVSVGDVCPREIETGDLMKSVSDRIKTILTTKPEDFECVLLTSSGTGAVEMVISSLPKGAKVLNLINGAYGDRIEQMLKVYKIKNKSLDFNEGIFDLKQIKAELEVGSYTHISMIHCETTTGVINDLDAISKLAKKFNAELVVDAMSSAFAYPIDLHKQRISYLCCSSNKLVQGMAGLGIVLVNKKSLIHCNPRTVYLDLKAQCNYFNKTNQMRFTPPVQIINALSVALDELIEETVEGRFLRYKSLNDTIRNKMESLGFETLIDKSKNSVVITSFIEPDDFVFEEFHNYLKKKGFVIYPGKVSNQNTFRLSNIGDISEDDVSKFIKHVEDFLEC